MKGSCISLVILISCLGNGIRTNKVLFLVVEGLTENLIGRIATPAIDALVAKGAIASLKPEFPSETLPTLQAMMTGQHTEVTGILDLEVRGSLPGTVLKYEEDAEFWNYRENLTTLWNLNNQLEGHKTGSILWPGADYPIDGMTNNLRWGVPYDIVLDVSDLKNGTKDQRRKRDVAKEESEDPSPFVETDFRDVENVHIADTNSSITEYIFNKTTDQEWIMWNSQIKASVEWLSQKKDPVNLVLFYVNQPGQIIRAYGPESNEADFAVQKVDQMIANLVEQLQKKKIFDDIDIIITGCHGFTEVSIENVYDISGLADPNDFIGHSPVINIQPKKNELDTFAKLNTGEKDKFDLYTKNRVPDRYHYKNNDRVDDIVLVAKEGFVFASDFWKDIKKLNKEQRRKDGDNLNNKYGKAGYDNALDSMQSLIILHGPGIHPHPTPEHLKPMIDAVDVFPLLCHLLDLPSIKSNGSLHAVRNLLSNPPSQSIEVIKKMVNYYTTEDKLPKTVTILVISTLVLILLICCGACAIRRRKNIGKNHNYRYSQVKNNRRIEGRVDGSETNDDKVGLLTSSIMEEDFEETI